VLEALKRGGRFADYREVFMKMGHHPDKTGYEKVTLPDSPRETHAERLSLIQLTRAG